MACLAASCLPVEQSITMLPRQMIQKAENTIILLLVLCSTTLIGADGSVLLGKGCQLRFVFHS